MIILRYNSLSFSFLLKKNSVKNAFSVHSANIRSTKEISPNVCALNIIDYSSDRSFFKDNFACLPDCQRMPNKMEHYCVSTFF